MTAGQCLFEVPDVKVVGLQQFFRSAYSRLHPRIIDRRLSIAKRLALPYYRRKRQRWADYREWIERTGRRRVTGHFAHYEIEGDYDAEHLASQLFELTNAVAQRMGKVSDGQRVLDVGASDGLFLELVPSAQRVGVNILSECAVKIKAEGHPVCQGDIESLPFPDKVFDHVICCETLEHLPNPIGALRELGRVCRGKLYLSIPWLPTTRINARSTDVSHPEDKHIFEFSESDFRNIVTHTNWRILYHANIEVFPGPPSPLHRWVFNKWLFPFYFPKLQFYEMEPIARRDV